MRHPANNLEWRKSFSCKDIAGYGNGEDGPRQERAMPSLRNISVVIQDYETLDRRAQQESRLCTGSDPGKNLESFSWGQIFNRGSGRRLTVIQPEERERELVGAFFCHS